MRVYFARKISDPTHIKIGSAKSIESRLENIARGVGPLHLFASLAGGVAVEREIHLKFMNCRIEGEWFRSCPDLEDYIRIFATPEDLEFSLKNGKWSTKACSPVGRRETDAHVAMTLLRRMYERYPRLTPISECQERAFKELSDINPSWTRRRIRALHELKGLRVDLSEVIDFLTLLEIPRTDWADFIAPLPNREAVAA